MIKPSCIIATFRYYTDRVTGLLPGQCDREEDNQTRADQGRATRQEITPVLLIGGLSPSASSEPRQRQLTPERLPGAVGLPSGDGVTRADKNGGIGQGISYWIEVLGAPFEGQV